MGGTAAAYGVARASLAPENAAPPYFGHRRGSAALAAAASKPHANWPEACVLADGLWTTGCQVAICKKLREVAERNVDKHSEIRRKLEQDFERLQEEREAECAERKLLRQNELEEVAQRKEEAECAQLERELQYERDRKEQRRKELWRKELRRKELEEIAQRKQEKDEQERLQQMCEAKRRDERTGLGLLELLDGGAVQERLVQFIMREPEPEPELETEPEPETCPTSHDMNCGPGCLICEGTCLVRRRAVPAGGAQAAVRKRAISVPVKAVVGLMLTNTTAQNALSTEFVWSWLCDEFWADKVLDEGSDHEADPDQSTGYTLHGSTTVNHGGTLGAIAICPSICTLNSSSDLLIVPRGHAVTFPTPHQWLDDLNLGWEALLGKDRALEQKRWSQWVSGSSV